MSYIKQYNKLWRSGKLVVCEKIKMIYTQLEEDMKNKKWNLDTIKSEKVIQFIEKFCKQSDGVIGKPLKLELFQKAFIEAAFGFIVRKTG